MVRISAILLTFLALIELIVLPALEDNGRIVSSSWKDENKRLIEFMKKRNLCDPHGDALWRSSGHQVSKEKSQCFRILVIGDSYVWGHGYSNMNDLWWRQLEKELHNRGFDDVEVIAAGYNGLNTRQEISIAERAVEEYNPDFIVWGYVWNDVDEGEEFAPQRKGDQSVLHRNTLPPRLENLAIAIAPALSDQLLALRRKNLYKQLFDCQPGTPEWYEYLMQGKNFEKHEETIADLAEFLNSTNLPHIVMFLPSNVSGRDNAILSGDFSQLKHLYTNQIKPVADCLAKHGIELQDNIDDCVDLLYKNKKLGNSELKMGINPADSHPAAWLNYFYAKQASDEIEPTLLKHSPKTTNKRDTIQPTINDWLPPSIDLSHHGDGQVYFHYPWSDEEAPRMPFRKKHVLLCFSEPATCQQIELSGPGLESAEIYLSIAGKSGYDENQTIKLAKKSGNNLKWTGNAGQELKDMHTAAIVADVQGKDRQLVFRLKK